MLGLERWVTDREVLPGCARVRTKCAERPMLVCEGSLYPREKLPDVSGPDLREARRYRMVSEPTLAVSWARVSQLRRHGAHGWCGPGVVTQHGKCASTGHTDMAKRGHSWLGIDRRRRRSLKGVRM